MGRLRQWQPGCVVGPHWHATGLGRWDTRLFPAERGRTATASATTDPTAADDTTASGSAHWPAAAHWWYDTSPTAAGYAGWRANAGPAGRPSPAAEIRSVDAGRRVHDDA